MKRVTAVLSKYIHISAGMCGSCHIDHFTMAASKTTPRVTQKVALVIPALYMVQRDPALGSILPHNILLPDSPPTSTLPTFPLAIQV